MEIGDVIPLSKKEAKAISTSIEKHDSYIYGMAELADRAKRINRRIWKGVYKKHPELLGYVVSFSIKDESLLILGEAGKDETL